MAAVVAAQCGQCLTGHKFPKSPFACMFPFTAAPFFIPRFGFVSTLGQPLLHPAGRLLRRGNLPKQSEGRSAQTALATYSWGFMKGMLWLRADKPATLCRVLRPRHRWLRKRRWLRHFLDDTLTSKVCRSESTRRQQHCNPALQAGKCCIQTKSLKSPVHAGAG